MLRKILSFVALSAVLSACSFVHHATKDPATVSSGEAHPYSCGNLKQQLSTMNRHQQPAQYATTMREYQRECEN